MPSAWLRRSSPPQIWDVCSCEKELSPSHGSLPGEQLFQLKGSPEIHFSEPRCSGSVWEYQLPESSRADIPHSFQQQEPAKTFQGKGRGSVQLPLCHEPPSGWLSPGCDISWPRVTHSDTPGRSQCRVCYPKSLCVIPGTPPQHKAASSHIPCISSWSGRMFPFSAQPVQAETPNCRAGEQEANPTLGNPG